MSIEYEYFSNASAVKILDENEFHVKDYFLCCFSLTDI